MKHSKGSISFIYLIALLFLSLFAQLMLLHLKNDYERSFAYAQAQQQRRLNSSLMHWLLAQQPEAGEFSFTYTTPAAQQEQSIAGQHIFSDDQSFDYYSAQVYSSNASHKLYRLGFHPSQELQSLGRDYMFISKYIPTGTEYLTDSSLYTSTGGFTMPAISFLSNKAGIYLEMPSIHENGFANNCTYLKQASTLTYSGTAPTTKGKALIACTKSLVLQRNFCAPDRIVLISNESITLQDNVSLSNALIIAKGNVNIGKNCKINGIVFSNSTIKFQGSGTFTHDTAVVADYVSAIFIA